MEARPLQVLIVADYPALRAGLRELLHDAASAGAVEVVAALESNALDLATLERADVALIDLGGPIEAGIVGDLPAVILLDRAVAGAVAGLNGATPRGWLPRDAGGPELVAALRAVAQGLHVVAPALGEVLRGAGAPAFGAASIEAATLTPRELDVLRLLAGGLPNKAIARELDISEHTVKFHVGALLSKLDAQSRTEAVTTAVRAGLLAL